MSKFVGTGSSSYGKRIYRAAVSQRLRNSALVHALCGDFPKHLCHSPIRRIPRRLSLAAYSIYEFAPPFDVCNPMTRHVVVSDAEIA
jgi:hypothetical protein